MKKNILILNKLFFPHKGGVETTVNEHALWLSKNNDVNVLVSNEKSFTKTSSYKLNKNLTIIKSSKLFTLFSMPFSISYIYYFLKLIRKADILFLHEPWPIGTLLVYINKIIFKKKYTTIIFWHADTKKLKLIDELLFLIQKKIIKYSKFIIVSHKKVLQESKLKQIIFPEGKLLDLPIPIVIENKPSQIIGEDIKLFFSSIEKKDIEIFFFFGRLVKYKGVEVLINSFDLIKNNKILFIAGKGGFSKKLFEKTNLKKNIFFINRFLNDKEKLFLFKKSTAFLFPSISNSESLGLTQIEALSVGCPVINTRLKTAVPYVSIDEKTGRTIRTRDHNALACAINNFPSKNSAKWRYFHKQAISRYKSNFSREIFEKKFTEIFKKV